MNLYEIIQLLILLLAAAPVAFAALSRWATANHNDRLARIVDGAGRIAAEIRETLQGLPATVDAAAVRQALVAQGAKALTDEFAESAAKIGATPEKIATILDREVAKTGIPSAAFNAALGAGAALAGGGGIAGAAATVATSILSSEATPKPEPAG